MIRGWLAAARAWLASRRGGDGRDARGEPDRQAIGIWGERVAADYLEGKGYRILARRLRIGPHDELDIVARQGETLVFVEIKARRGESFGRPADSVDRRKRHALSRAAVRYLRSLRNPRIYFRFDVVEILGGPGDGARDIRHIENAFQLDRRYTLPA